MSSSPSPLSLPDGMSVREYLSTRTAPWRELPPLSREELTAIPDLPPLQAQLLHNRGYTTPAAMRAFLETDWRASAPLPDLEKAVSRLRLAIERGERIVVFGDFDVDGVTSCAVALLALRALGARAEPYIPSRLDDGRGPSLAAIDAICARGADLLLTTDCGVTNADELAYAASCGLGVIVTDHHSPQGPLAPALALVNPRLGPEISPDWELTGVGVAFRLAEALLASKQPQAVAPLLDLVALGTLADVAWLSPVNWALARAGLRRLNGRPRPGLLALAKRARLAPGEIGEHDISFRIAPRLNAGSRMGEPELPLELLLAEDMKIASSLAARLDTLNAQRQEMTEGVLAEARAQIDGRPDKMIVVSGADWPVGLLGLVANRLLDQYGVTAVVLSHSGAVCRGSARGPDGVNLVEALGRRRERLRYFGGHARAAGFTVAMDDLDGVLAALRSAIPEPLTMEGAPLLRRAEIAVDCHLPLNRVTWDYYEKIGALAPFGQGFPEPVFVARRVRLLRAWASGVEARNLRLLLRDGERVLNVLWAQHGWLAGALGAEPDLVLDVVYTFEAYRRTDATERELLARVMTVRLSPVGAQPMGPVDSGA
jgi:single-stranded-DNA-specific exonuclease